MMTSIASEADIGGYNGRRVKKIWLMRDDDASHSVVMVGEVGGCRKVEDNNVGVIWVV